MLKALLATLVAATAASGSLLAQDRSQPAMIAARAALLALVQKDAEGFASARAPWRFRFPADHAAHPDHRTESWRFSGSLATREGRRFGFQLTFFRVGINPPATQLGPSAWAARDAYWGQLSVSDAAGKRQYEFERLARAAMGLSGAQSSPLRVWVQDWSMEVHDAATFTLRGAQDNVGIELSLAAVKPPVTRTAEETQSALANTFHAYLLTRLSAKGTIRIDERVLDVEGIAWLDRAWGEVPLPVGAVVWDRFLLQLDDGRDVMGVRLRRRDASGDPVVSGLLVERDGTARILEARDLAIDPVDRRWRLRMPGHRLELYVDPYMSSSGLARITGSIEGHGYVEVAGDGATASRP